MGVHGNDDRPGPSGRGASKDTLHDGGSAPIRRL